MSSLKTASKLKGHQIIGELRLSEDLPKNIYKYWRVTRSLVSYDYLNPLKILLLALKGHQIIGELRPPLVLLTFQLSILKGHQIIGELRQLSSYFRILDIIEGSPDHWWVTTEAIKKRLHGKSIEGSPDHWWVTTTYCCYNLWTWCYWRVTRSLVSYDGLWLL